MLANALPNENTHMGSQMTRQGGIHRNVHQDDVQERLGNSNARYSSQGLSVEHFNCLEGELVLFELAKQDDLKKGVVSGYEGIGLTVLNGLGPSTRSQPYHDFIQRFIFGGFCIGQANGSEKFPQPTVATQIGGTFTVKNTGNRPIRVGQFVYWDLPEALEVKGNNLLSQNQAYVVSTGGYGFHGKSTKRILPVLLPFNENKIFTKLTKKALLNAGASPGPLAEAAKALKNVTKLIWVQAALHFARLGVDFRTLDTNAYDASKTDFNSVLNLYKLFKVKPVVFSHNEEDIDDVRAEGAEGADVAVDGLDGVTFSDLPFQALFSDKLVPYTDADIAGSEDAKLFKRDYENVLDDFLNASHHVRRFYENRIVGRALSNAHPGMKLDLMLGASC